MRSSLRGTARSLAIIAAGTGACQAALDFDQYCVGSECAGASAGQGGDAASAGSGGAGLSQAGAGLSQAGAGAESGAAGGASGSAGGDAGSLVAVFDRFVFARGTEGYTQPDENGVLANDSGQGTSVEVPSEPLLTARGGTVSLNAAGGFTYTPSNPRFWGDDTFSYTLRDASGATSTGRVRVTIEPDQITLEDLEAGAGNGFAITGSGAGDFAGYSVALAGDVNADGLADIVIGAYGSLAGEGAAHVVFGKASSDPVSLASLGDAGFTFNGGSALAGTEDRTGFSVAGAGDFNADGFDDVLVSAPGIYSAYVVFGGAALGGSVSSVNAFDGVVIDDAPEDIGFGTSVAGAGDVNDDGFADVIVGSPGTPDGGRAYVIFGGAALASPVDLASVEAAATGFAIYGIAPGAEAGSSVASAGDINADGRADVIIGSPRASAANLQSRGAAYVVFGRTSSTTVALAELEALSLGFGIFGGIEGEQAGYAVAGRGDANGDSVPDLLIGAPYGNSTSGTGYLVYGRTDSAAVELATLASSSAGFRVTGADDFDNAGGSVASAGDINGDGVADLVIGATNVAPEGGASAGGAYLIYGTSEPALAALSLASLSPERGRAILGVSEGDFAGISVASGGDVNGDGLSDFVIGAANVSDPARIGKAYVLFGWGATSEL